MSFNLQLNDVVEIFNLGEPVAKRSLYYGQWKILNIIDSDYEPLLRLENIATGERTYLTLVNGWKVKLVNTIFQEIARDYGL